MLPQAERKNVGVGAALISILAVLIIGTAGLIGYISFHNGQKAAENLANQMQESILARVENNLDEFFKKPHALNRMNAEALRSGLVDPRDLDGLRAHFFHQIQAFDSVMTCAFGSEAGDFTSAGRRSEGGFDCAIADKRVDNDYRVYLLNERGEPSEIVTVVRNYDPKRRSWYQAALEASGPVWSPIYVWASQSNIGISAVLPVYENTGELLGVQLSALSLGHIGQFLKNVGMAKAGQIFIMERSGLLVASSIAEPLLQEDANGSEVRLKRVSAADSVNPLIRGTADYLSQEFTDFDRISNKRRMKIAVEEQSFFLSVAPFADEYGLDWLVVIVIPASDLMGPVNANIRATILAGSMILAVALMLGMMITRIITHPILQLSQAARRMSQGKWERIGNTTRFREIGQLTDSFNMMARQLGETFETLEQRVRERTGELAGVNRQLHVEIAEHKKTGEDRERLIAELREALESVKMLSGLLPICSGCKKIRDDGGNWHDVAVYVRDHSEAEFSHGICPECMEQLYPEYLKNDE